MGTLPSKRLPDAEVEAAKRVARASVHRDAEVKPEWPHRFIITNPWPYTDTQVAQIIARQGTVDVAGIDEYHTAEIAADREAQLNAPHQQAAAADRPPLVVQWADPLRRIAANA